ncbi:MAG: hypothetical protein A3C35_08635, partial [Omnitrophica bacterium RIFCSPHIGHO2_02_FULL_46_11]
MNKLTEQQKRAVQAVRKNVCVSAGAGTGKTRVLVERFLYLVQENLARPKEILAITFTEKAAQEMKERIAKGLRERNLEEARRELENAYIGTIHSFCARLLREHPIEAGVDPNFRVLKEEEAGLLKVLALDQLMEARFQEPAVFELLRAYSEKGIREAIEQLVNCAHAFGLEAASLILSVQQDDEKQSRINVSEALKPLKRLKGKEEDCAAIEEALEKEISNWEELETFKELKGRFKRSDSKPEIGIFKDVWDQWIASRADQLVQPVRTAFLNLVCDFESRYKGLKGERVSLDFNDLEYEALRLIEGDSLPSKACRELYRRNFKFVMVDEFQDTSPLQDRLIVHMSRPDNLFIVGDWRQSIYGFRGAEASLFLDKERLFLKGGKGERISLIDNFRSRGELLNPVNLFFKELWAGKEISFEPLQSALEFGKKDNPSVQFLTVNQAEEEGAQDGRMREAQVLAEEIKRLAHSGAYDYKDFAMLFRAGTDIFLYEYELRNLHIPYYVVSGRGFYHRPEIRDLISFFEVLENPYLDIPFAAVLRSPLVQISDDALFWLAEHSTRLEPKEPFYRAFLNSREIPEMNEEDRQKLDSFRTFFLELLGQKEKWSISECLEIVFERTQYDRYILGLPQGKRHFANLRKLEEIARELESRSPVHLGDFIRYIKGLETQEVRESEAQVEALEGNVVKLMTIHKAKGLEFKVVILPDLNRKGQNERARFLFDPEYGLGIRASNEASGESEDTLTFLRIKEKLIQRNHEESKRLLYVGMTRAEDHLILSGVSKSERNGTEEGGFDDGANWYEWIDQWSASNPGQFERRMIQSFPLKQGNPFSPLAEHKKIKTALEAGKPLEVKMPEEVGQIIESLKPIEPIQFDRIDLPVSAFAAFEHDPEEYRRTYELGILPQEGHPEAKPKDLGSEMLSATQTGGPAVLLGGRFAQHDKIEEWSESEDETELSAAEFGTVVHRIFEYLVSQPEKSGERLPYLLTRFSENLDQKTRDEIKKLSLQFLKSKQFVEIKQAKARHPEIPFVLRLHSGIIQGTLDLLYQTADGKWVIVDYKTSRIDDGGDLKIHAERYQGQLLLYALACYELLKISVSRASLYFVRADRSFD